MDIERRKEGGILTLVLQGRLDAAWCPEVQKALSAAVRDGEHHIHLDMAGVDYISSAGLRVLIGAYKQLLAIKGTFSLRNVSPEVTRVLDLAGLGQMLTAEKAPPPTEAAGEAFASARADWEVYAEPAGPPMKVRCVGESGPSKSAAGEVVTFPPRAFGIGLAALAAHREEAGGRLGEFLAVAGCAAHLPPGASRRPDFLLSEQNLVPTVWMESGLVGEGSFSLLVRFEAKAEARTVGWREIVQTALAIARCEAAAIVAATETAGLVGASLLAAPDDDLFAFPAIRDRLSFTSERSFRDSTSLIAGMAARPGSAWERCLRPTDESVQTHFHAAAFPYRPLRKGRIALEETAASLFDSQGLQSVLHLICDSREPGGAGESEFTRGACWIAPLAS